MYTVVACGSTKGFMWLLY